ncbi:MAG: glycoside hydrolase family 18 protein [Candidatus Yanofskybacteria bacterium]|nr:glycoside hydrolase family 18 protein [Candidatus Yanofskybacteria bacterium]
MKKCKKFDKGMSVRLRPAAPTVFIHDSKLYCLMTILVRTQMQKIIKNSFSCIGLSLVLIITVASFSALFSKTSSAAIQQWSVGYWTPWGNPAISPSQIEWGGLTHVVHWAALVQPDGSLDLNTQLISSDGPALISAARSKDVKVLLGIAQPFWQGQTNNLPQAATQNRAALVNNIMNAVDTYGFDGVDLDWEPFDSGANGQAMQSLAMDLRIRLGTKILSTTAIVTDYTYWGSVHSYFDRISVMTYDLTGTWNPYSWHNSALYDPDGMVWSVDLAVSRFTANGVPIGKLSIGIPFFGYDWIGGDITGPQQIWSSLSTLKQIYYQGLFSLITEQNYQWDSLAKVPYLNGGRFLTYDDARSVTEKVNYAKNRGLGGWIIWELSGDYIPSQNPNQPLLAAIKNAMAAGATPTPTATPSPAPTSTPAPTPPVNIPTPVPTGSPQAPLAPTPVPTPTPPISPSGGSASSGGGGGGGGGGGIIPLSRPAPIPNLASPTSESVPEQYGLKDGDVINAISSTDPDVYIVNTFGFKRLFLNPIIFSFYGHLGGFSKVRAVSPTTRDTFPTSGLFRNCETNSPRVYGIEVTGEDTGVLHWINTTAEQAIADDPYFFKKVFCINNNEFDWYQKGTDYTSIQMIPKYIRNTNNI